MTKGFHDQEFINTKFGENGQIEVIGWFGEREGNNKLYSIKCHTCSEDPELHGDAVYQTSKRFLVCGSLPCGCSPRPRWTERQQHIRIKRMACVRGDVEFLGISGSYKGNKTKLKLLCKVDGHEWHSTTIANFTNGGGCPLCKNRRIGEASSKPHEDSVEEFLSMGLFLPGTEIWKSDRISPSTSASKVFWKYTCPKCSDDEYVKAGLCSGVFEMQSYRFRDGSRACRCAPSVKWTKEQREYQVKKALQEDGKGGKFVGWDGDKHGKRSKILLDCPTHGESDVSTHSFFSGQRCPKCTEFGYKPGKPGFVYVLKVDHAESKFTGYGITNLKRARITQHRCSLKKTEHTIVDKVMFSVDGLDARKIEKGIVENFECVPQETTGFKREATAWEKFSEVVEFIKSWLVGNGRQVSYA